MVRSCLQTLFRESSELLSVSNVKRLFRSRFELELSETLLGHSKLTTLLMDERLRDVCAVQLHGHGHAVVEASSEPSEPDRNEAEVPSFSEKALSLQDWDLPVMEEALHQSERLHQSSSVKNTFIHLEIPESPRDTQHKGPRRSQSMPALASRAGSTQEAIDSEQILKDTSPESPDFFGGSFSWHDTCFSWHETHECCDSAASTASAPSMLELTDSEPGNESWSEIDDRNSSPGVMLGESHASRCHDRLQALHDAGEEVLSQVWCAPQYLDPMWQDAGLWMGPSFVVSPCEQAGSWELSGMMAVHVWRPHNKATARRTISLAQHCMESEAAKEPIMQVPPPPPPPASRFCA
jgi:hypothetical protein